MENNIKIPKIGIIMCNSGASNAGYITGSAVFRVIEKIDNNQVGICSLPSLANSVPRQVMLVQKINHLIVIDGCHQQCAKKILENIHISYNDYINLEKDLGLKKKGPFTSFECTDYEIEKVSSYILEKIYKILNKSRKEE